MFKLAIGRLPDLHDANVDSAKIVGFEVHGIPVGCWCLQL
jgi:hypothetical protein